MTPNRVFRLLLTAASCGLLFAPPLHAQLPKDQDKTGRGDVGHKQPDATANPNPGKETISNGPTQAPSKLNGTKKEKAAPKPGTTLADEKADAGKGKTPDKTVYDFELPTADGKAMPLKTLKGKTVILVNLARNSSYNAQLAALSKLSEDYKAKGVVVVGVPSNDFGDSEPGTDAEVQKAYKTDARVPFLVTAKADVAGDKELPLYGFLTKGKGAPEQGAVHWNYTKFLIDKTGKPVARFNQDIAPDSVEFLSTLEQVLDGTFKPKRGGGPEGDGGGNSDSN